VLCFCLQELGVDESRIVVSYDQLTTDVAVVSVLPREQTMTSDSTIDEVTGAFLIHWYHFVQMTVSLRSMHSHEQTSMAIVTAYDIVAIVQTLNIVNLPKYINVKIKTSLFMTSREIIGKYVMICN